MNIKETIEISKTITEIGICITTVIALIMGGIEFKNQLRTQKEEKVMQLLLKQYEEELNISKIRSSLHRDFDLSNAREILGKKVNDDIARKNYRDFMEKFIIDNKDRYENVLVLTDFYNSIASCVESKLCDKNIAVNLFQQEGNDFFGNYSPFFCYQNSEWGNTLIKEYSLDFYSTKNHSIRAVNDRIKNECPLRQTS